MASEELLQIQLEEVKKMETNGDKKLRGGYYTPNEIARFITKWVITKESNNILEPSCGDGQFIESAIEILSSLGINKRTIPNKIIGVELNAIEAKKSSERFTKYLLDGEESIIEGDFFANCHKWLDNQKEFDSIIGNPPFIRYQDFPEKFKTSALDLMKRANLKPNKLMNTWIPFVVGSTLLLRSGGRIGFVLPAELFQVNYASEIRKFLSDSYSKVIIITFRKLVFANIQQEVVLFLGEKNGRKSHGINIIEMESTESLKDTDLNKKNIDETLKVLDSSTEKWTQYFLSEKEVKLLRKLKINSEIGLTGSYMSVDVGIVTGQNNYFVLNKDRLKEHGLENQSQKIFSKSIQLKGIVATNEDFKQSAQRINSNYLVNIPDTEYKHLPKYLQKYIDIGEKEEVHKGYKCRIRKNWWVIPSLWKPDAFMLRQVHNYPKIILNSCQATNTDTIHRIKFMDGVNGEIIASAFLNSLTLAFSEVTGRSYGGGVLTFEPTEAENLPLPLEGAEHLNFQKIDALIRKGEIEKVLDITDKILLKDGLNLSDSEIKSLRTIWKKLRDRRLYRKRNYDLS
ncbi:MAG: N-6 DNA methylase [Nanoarchaeota archaeon]